MRRKVPPLNMQYNGNRKTEYKVTQYQHGNQREHEQQQYEDTRFSLPILYEGEKKTIYVHNNIHCF